MPVDSRHRLQEKRGPQVSKVRAFLEGDVEGYITKLPGHDDDDFKVYKERAYYLPAVGRTLQAFTGLILSPEPVVHEAPEALKQLMEDLTYDGEPFNRVTHSVVTEVCTSNLCVVVIDHPSVSEEEAGKLTKAQAEQRGLRAYARLYGFDDVLDWRMDVAGGQKRLTHLRLRETYTEPDPTDEYVMETKSQVRVLDLVKNVYRVRIFRQGDGSVWTQYGEDRFPTIDGETIDAIPAVAIRPGSLDLSRDEPPILHEMCSISESHLNDSADRQWGLAWCGSPTLVLSGYDGEEAVRLGSSAGISLGDGGTAELLQMSGEAVGALRQSMEDKRRDMAAVGARILTDGGSSQISTETARLERAGEHSVLEGVANTVGDGLTKVLQWLAEWSGIDAPDVNVELNTDFLPSGLQPGELQEWTSAMIAGAMPLSVFVNRLKQRGVVSPEWTEDRYREELELDGDPPEDEDDPEPE